VEEAAMEVVTFKEARASLKNVMDRVIDDRVGIAVVREKRGAVVIMSLAEYNAIQETLYLQKSPKNAKRLRASIEEFDAGEGVERDNES
jgi:antitoxin YefM